MAGSRRADRAAVGAAESAGDAVDEILDDAPVERNTKARVVVAGAAVLYTGLFAYLTMRHHEGMGTQAFDVGLYDQGIWLLSRFKTPFVTIMGRNLFGDHTSFALLPLVPLYWVFPTAKTLLFAQALAIGCSAVPVFLLARHKLRSEVLAALLAIAFLLMPVLGWMNLEQFHPDILEIPFVLFAAYFMARERWVPFLICICALLLVKEDAVLITVGFGAYILCKHNRRIGVVTIVGSALYAAAAFWVILPALNGVGTLNGWRIPFGGPIGFVKTTFLHPGKVMSYVFVEDRMWYVWQLFAPVGLLATLAPGVLFIALPALGANLFSTFLYQYDIHYHYSTLVAPMVMVATIYGIADIARTMVGRRRLVILTLAASVVAACWWGPTPIGRDRFVPVDPNAAQAVSVREAIRRIPADGVVSAYHGWVPQVDHRERIYMFPNPWKATYWGTFEQEGERLPIAETVDWVLLPTLLDPELGAVVLSVRAEFETVYERNDVQLLRRRTAH